MKDFFITVDTETTNDNKVADFAAVITDRKGEIVNQCAILVSEIYNDRKNHCLFTDNKNPLWTKKSLATRYARYETMLENGSRTLGSVAAINNWLAKAAIKYRPVLTAYNLPFDLDKCSNTNIDLTIFERSFCLWSAAYTLWAQTSNYKSFVLITHAFNAPTALGNMTYKTNAETMARFVLGDAALPDEPHTALEDVLFYELPILNKVLKSSSTKKILKNLNRYNWRDLQVRNHFQQTNSRMVIPEW